MAPYTVMQMLRGTNVADQYPTIHLKEPCTVSTLIVRRKVCHAEQYATCRVLVNGNNNSILPAKQEPGEIMKYNLKN